MGRSIRHTNYMSNETFFTSSALARAAGVHRATLARWINSGLLVTSRRSNSAGHALYTNEDLLQTTELARERKAAWRPDKP